MNNDILLVLLLSILSTPADENGEVDFASNTNFLLLLLLSLNNSRTINNICNYGSCCEPRCNNTCGGNNCGSNRLFRNNTNLFS